MVKLKIEYLPPDALKPYRQNARVHDADDVEALEESIEEFDFSDPIGIWGPDNLIVEGHGRLLAAKNRPQRSKDNQTTARQTREIGPAFFVPQ